MKKILKPTKSKIVLGIGIALLNIIMALYAASALLCTQFCEPANIIQKILSPTIAPFFIIPFFTEIFEDMVFIPEMIEIIFTVILSGMILLFLWYIMACIAVRLFAKK